MTAVAWRIKKPEHIGDGWWFFTCRDDFDLTLESWREDGYDLPHEAPSPCMGSHEIGPCGHPRHNPKTGLHALSPTTSAVETEGET